MYNWTQDLNYTSGQKLAIEASSLDLKDQESGESEIKDFSPLSCCAFEWALSNLLLDLVSLQYQPPEGKNIQDNCIIYFNSVEANTSRGGCKVQEI